MAVDVRIARDDERELLHQMGQHAFAHRPRPFDPETDRAATPLDRRLVATVDGMVAGKLAVWELGHWFGGRRVPMGGVAGVVVKPEFRGYRVASTLLRTALGAMRDRGEVLTSLYPMNHTLYRRAGWQSAGRFPEHRVLSRVLADLPRPQRSVEFRRRRADDVTTLTELYHANARWEQGNLWYGPEFAGRRLGGGEDGYVAMIDGTITGGVTLTKGKPKDDDELYSLEISSLVAADADTELAIWRLVGTNHPLARVVEFVAPPERTLPHLFGEREMRPIGSGWVWMTRFVDASGAIEARGYAEHVDVEVHLEIADELAPWNAGKYVLRVVDGKGSLQPGGTGRVQLAIGEFASVYTGWADPHQLARWGMITGAPGADLDALHAAFSGPTPWMRDYF